MRPLSRLTIPTLGLAIAVSACGGGDDERSEREQGNRSGAESAVRSYLTALVEKDGRRACAKFTSDYQRALMRQYRDFAREERIDSCPRLIAATTRAAPDVTFEGKRLTREVIGQIRFKTTVIQSGQEWNASVTGRMGMQRYELETRDGDWLISNIDRLR